MTNDTLKTVQALVESARLLGVTQAKKGFGCYTEQDSRFEVAMHKSISHHTNTLVEQTRSEVATPVARVVHYADQGAAFNKVAFLLSDVPADTHLYATTQPSPETSDGGRAEQWRQAALAFERRAMRVEAELQAVRAGLTLKDGVYVEGSDAWAAERAALTAERDEADRRAGAAERQLECALESGEARASWLREAKAAAGYPDNISFDVVWHDALRALKRSKGPAIEPVDGDWLPAIGSKVRIRLNSVGRWIEHTVIGYYAWPDLGLQSHLHRVFVRVVDDKGHENARLLKDVRAIATGSTS